MNNRIIRRKDAQDAGLSRYFTGKPCVHGHSADRYVCNGACVICHTITVNKLNKDHKKNKTKRGLNILQGKRRWYLHKHYGLTEDQYSSMLMAQDGKCAICKNKEKVNLRWGKIPELAVDHDHITGEIRGLLCIVCNRRLGVFERRKKEMETYLADHSSSSPITATFSFGRVVMF